MNVLDSNLFFQQPKITLFICEILCMLLIIFVFVQKAQCTFLSTDQFFRPDLSQWGFNMVINFFQKPYVQYLCKTNIAPPPHLFLSESLAGSLELWIYFECPLTLKRSHYSSSNYEYFIILFLLVILEHAKTWC